MFGVFRKPLTVTREQPGQYVDGVWQPGTSATLTVNASVQPTTPDEMQMLPEGERDRQAFTLYSDTELLVSNDNTQQPSDRVQIDGATYKASARAPWQNSIIPHHRTVVVKENEQ